MYKNDNTSREDNEFLGRKRELSKKTNDEEDLIKIENLLAGCEEFK